MSTFSSTLRPATALPLSILSVLMATTALAQGPVVEEIVVTAQKREEKLQDVPISVSVLSGAQLDGQTIGGVTDALRAVPGIGIANTAQGGATQLSIRGVSSNGATLNGASTVAYYIDAVPFGLVKSSILPDTTAYDMQRIEVLRGPQGTLYGANALNGVVRLLTNDADLDHFELKARVGLADTKGGDVSYRGDVAVNVPLVDGKLAMRAVAGYETAGGWIDQPAQTIKDANDVKSQNYRLKFNGQGSDAFSYGLAVWISRVDQDAPNYADNAGIQTTPVPLPQRLDYDTFSAKLAYDFGAFTISSATSYLNFNNTSQRDYNFLGPRQTLFTDIDSDVFTEEILLNSASDGDWRWSGGGFYRDADDRLYQTLFVLPAPINFQDKSRSLAGFGEVTKILADGTVELTGGLRYFRDKVSQNELSPTTGNPAQVLARRTSTFDALTPRAVVTWLPNDQFTGYASYSQGFRSGFNQSPTVIRTAPALPPVDADKLTNYEIGAKGTLADGLVTFDAAVFYIDWHDVVQNVNLLFAGAPIAASINGPSASGLGTDLAVTLRPTPEFQIGGTFSYSGLELDDPVVTNLNATTTLVVFQKGERLSFSSKYTAGAFADYIFPVSGELEGKVSGSFNYRSKTPGRLVSGGVSRLFISDAPLLARASFALSAPDSWTATVYMENLSNWDNILQPPTDVSLQYRARPRTIGLQFEVRM